MSGVRVDEVETTRLQVKNTGVRATVRDTDHAYTNHFIEQSRPYFPNKKLQTYIDCRYLQTAARWLCFASLFGFLGAVGGGGEGIPLLFSITCGVFFLIYCQHECVNQGSIPVVLKQPVVNGQRAPNSFYELTITELKGVALENYRAGIGFVKMTQGTIKFQAFNEGAVKRMRSARCQSRLMLFLFLVTFVYNVIFTVVARSRR